MGTNHHVHQQGAVNPNLDFAVGFCRNFEGVELVLRILPAALFEASFFTGLADNQKGTFACTTAFDATFGCSVVHVVEGVVKADEVVLVGVSEHDARVIIIDILDRNSKLVVGRGFHESLSDKPRAATIATRLVPVNETDKGRIKRMLPGSARHGRHLLGTVCCRATGSEHEPVAALVCPVTAEALACIAPVATAALHCVTRLSNTKH